MTLIEILCLKFFNHYILKPLIKLPSLIFTSALSTTIWTCLTCSNDHWDYVTCSYYGALVSDESEAFFCFMWIFVHWVTKKKVCFTCRMSYVTWLWHCQQQCCQLAWDKWHWRCQMTVAVCVTFLSTVTCTWRRQKTMFPPRSSSSIGLLCHFHLPYIVFSFLYSSLQSYHMCRLAYASSTLEWLLL